jgi:hypothetical protein
LFGTGNDNLDGLRSLLEASWNVQSMGVVPSSPEQAAEAAASALISALNRNQVPLFFVDILLPQYDITRGTNLYDEVRAVEFCIALAERLEGKSQIIVRDSKVLNVVNRIFNAREGYNSKSRDMAPSNVEPVSSREDARQDSEQNIVVYDDFADFDLGSTVLDNAEKLTDVEKPPSFSSDSEADLDLFRKKLASTWTNDSVNQDEVREEERIQETREIENTEKFFRLTSMLGEASISSGSDMMDDVAKAVTANALPRDDEDTIIILSAVSKEEMLAVRAIASNYKGKKKIILVNAKLSVVPRELVQAQTVYSILPLIAAQRSGGGSAPTGTPSPQVVVLRRYPRDWEVFVDIGKGFDLADTMTPETAGKQGPPMEWVASVVKRYLLSNA